MKHWLSCLLHHTEVTVLMKARSSAGHYISYKTDLSHYCISDERHTCTHTQHFPAAYCSFTRHIHFAFSLKPYTCGQFLPTSPLNKLLFSAFYRSCHGTVEQDCNYKIASYMGYISSNKKSALMNQQLGKENK